MAVPRRNSGSKSSTKEVGNNSVKRGTKPKPAGNRTKKYSSSPRTSSSISSVATKSSNQYKPPPWQTISSKDMAKNVKAEKERRRVAQQGLHLSPQELVDQQLTLERSTAFLSPQDKALLAWKPFSLNSNKHEVLFQGSFLQKQLPPRLGVPEVAFLGRSNVGKSSLLNKLVGKSDLARVGKTPGATASVNLYGIFENGSIKKTKTYESKITNSNNKAVLGLVDLPGFGYAKLDKETKESVQETAENYLEKRKELALGVLLVDSRRVPSVDDKAVLAALFDMGLPLIVVATKVDKLSSQRQVDEALQIINTELGLPEGQPLSISCLTGQGIKDLWKIILEACEGRVKELRENVAQGRSDNESSYLVEGEMPFDDEADIAYSQGYDWVHGTVMYEEEDMENWNDDEHVNDSDAYDDLDEAAEREDVIVPPKMTFKDLKKKAREMEKRGEFY